MSDLDVSTITAGDAVELTRDRVFTVTMPGGRRTTMTIDAGTTLRILRVYRGLMDIDVGAGTALRCDNHNLTKVLYNPSHEMPPDARVWGRRV